MFEVNLICHLGLIKITKCVNTFVWFEKDIIDKKIVDRCSSCFFFVLLFVKFEGNKGNKLGLIDFPSDFYRLFSGYIFFKSIKCDYFFSLFYYVTKTNDLKFFALFVLHLSLSNYLYLVMITRYHGGESNIQIGPISKIYSR
jgi:hypothetical protein